MYTSRWWPILTHHVVVVVIIEAAIGLAMVMTHGAVVVYLLRLPTVQCYLTVNRCIKDSRFGSETLKSASLTCIVLRLSQVFKKKAVKIPTSNN
jgi:hypothetical protein